MDDLEYKTTIDQRKKDAKKIMENAAKNMNEGTGQIGEIVGQSKPQLKDKQ